MKKFLALLLLITLSFADDNWSSKTAIENTLTSYYINNYKSAPYLEDIAIANNRFRTFLDINEEYSDEYDINFKLIVDANSYHHDLDDDTSLGDDYDDDEVSIYRGYVEYIDDNHQLGIGKQTIPIGIGTLYSPLNIFNPLDATSLEAEERSALSVAKYEYAINELSTFLFVYNEEIITLRLKYFIDSVDIGLVAMKNTQDGKNEQILGYELEARLFESSWDLKSEAMIIKDDNATEQKIMVGFNYGYNDFTLSTEYFYDSFSKSDEIAANLFYQIDGYWTFMFTDIYYIDTKQEFAMPSIQYSLSDNHSLRFGAVIGYNLDDKTPNELESDSYFVQLVLNY